VSDSYVTASVSGSGRQVGGLVGDNAGTVIDSHATGSVSGVGNGVGGLVGENDRAVSESYALSTLASKYRIEPPLPIKSKC
jgi:The GLUG motif